VFIIPTLLGITLFSSVIANAIPTDPMVANLPQSALNNEATVQAFRRHWGLDRPPVERYLTYVANLLRGDMGVSIKSQKPVLDDLKQFLPATVELATYGIVVGVLMGVTFGIVSAVWRNRVIDYVVRMVALLGVSFPVFLIALVGLTVFYVQLRWVGGTGRMAITAQPPPTVTGFFTIDSILSGQLDKLGNAISHLILPSIVLGSYVSGMIARVMRASLLEVMGFDYIRTARAKGLSERMVILRHALANAMIPVVTVIGLSYGNLLSGAVLTESIFAWPGLGRYMFRASTTQDFPAIMGGSLLIAFIYIMVNFFVDILYYFLDPRIRLG
jgi:peptide/nickel transport system permease protein